MNKSMTIQEVARLADVSVATVSRVLNGSPSVKTETKNKVMNIIEKFDYQPNLLGRDLRRSATKKVLVLVANLKRPILGEIVNGIEERAKEDGYYVLLCPTSESVEREQELLQMLKNRLVDGVIVIHSTLPEEDLSALGQKYSIVQCCEIKDASSTSCVSVNDEQAAMDAVQFLIKAGHRRIGMIGGLSSSYSTKLRVEGFLKALAQHDLPIEPALLKYGGVTHEDGERLADELLGLEHHPDAIFCMSDRLAIGCIKAIKKKNWHIPDDVAVIGFDNTEEATMASPELTTIHQPKYELGYQAMNRLIHNMTESEKKYNKVILQHKLIVRQSARF